MWPNSLALRRPRELFDRTAYDRDPALTEGRPLKCRKSTVPKPHTPPAQVRPVPLQPDHPATVPPGRPSWHHHQPHPSSHIPHRRMRRPGKDRQPPHLPQPVSTSCQGPTTPPDGHAAPQDTSLAPAPTCAPPSLAQQKAGSCQWLQSHVASCRRTSILAPPQAPPFHRLPPAGVQQRRKGATLARRRLPAARAPVGSTRE
jgi:hypothetical protein